MMRSPDTAVNATTASLPRNKTKSPTQFMAATLNALDSKIMSACGKKCVRVGYHILILFYGVTFRH